MTETDTQSASASTPPKPGEIKLEVVTVPVSDVDRAKAFYESLGWRLDIDIEPREGVRIVQFTPPGSACSISIGKGLTPAEPGSFQGSELAVYDVDVAREDLIGRGIEVSEVYHLGEDGTPFRARTRRVSPTGPSPRSRTRMATRGSFRRSRSACREDNRAIPKGLIMDVDKLAELLQEAEEHHGPYEATAPKHHWSGFYAAYIVARENGRTPEEADKDARAHMELVLAQKGSNS